MTTDTQALSAVGHIEVTGIAPDGLVMLVTNSSDFIADSVQKITLNDRVIFECPSNSLIVARAGGKWVIHNPGEEQVPARLVLAGMLAPTADLNGHLVGCDQQTVATVVVGDSGTVVSLTIPAGECSVLR